ncbi:MAG: pseudouridine-5'-phosphate glycosidase [Pyrinomonadaceae bacterium]|jgi:pseudouridine-5'-phosphate glycosidase
MKLRFSEEVSGALHFGRPIVALESTVIAHGLPYPVNLETAYNMERIIRDAGVTPATIAIFDGEISVGLSDAEFERLADGKDVLKLSRKDLPYAAALGLSGATTVASTALIAHRAGIRVFATGGIGGVHRGDRTDISADLPELARTPVIVVCSGAKIVLDLPATREWLETFGVTVLGWQCDEFPAFYSRSSGLKVDRRVENGRQVAKIADARLELGFTNSLLVTVPVPEKAEMRQEELEPLLLDALREAKDRQIKGKEITPFLLSRMSEKSNKRTLSANVALLENNAKVAAEIALSLNY